MCVCRDVCTSMCLGPQDLWLHMCVSGSCAMLCQCAHVGDGVTVPQRGSSCARSVWGRARESPQGAPGAGPSAGPEAGVCLLVQGRAQSGPLGLAGLPRFPAQELPGPPVGLSMMGPPQETGKQSLMNGPGSEFLLVESWARNSLRMALPLEATAPGSPPPRPGSPLTPAFAADLPPKTPRPTPDVWDIPSGTYRHVQKPQTSKRQSCRHTWTVVNTNT